MNALESGTVNDRQAMAGQNTIMAVYATSVAVRRALSELWKSGCEVSVSAFARNEETTNSSKSRRDEFWDPLGACLHCTGIANEAIPHMKPP